MAQLQQQSDKQPESGMSPLLRNLSIDTIEELKAKLAAQTARSEQLQTQVSQQQKMLNPFDFDVPSAETDAHKHAYACATYALEYVEGLAKLTETESGMLDNDPYFVLARNPKGKGVDRKQREVTSSFNDLVTKPLTEAVAKLRAVKVALPTVAHRRYVAAATTNKVRLLADEKIAKNRIKAQLARLTNIEQRRSAGGSMRAELRGHVDDEAVEAAPRNDADVDPLMGDDAEGLVHDLHHP